MQRARKFNTGKSAASAGQGIGSQWTETPEGKRKRLANEVLGISDPSTREPSAQVRKPAVDQTTKQIRERLVRLIFMHQVYWLTFQ
jgi:hypothetical protein